ncbi:hypothetical protein [Paenibacillus sp. 1-18]|uniref:hypothetical protein n=1 Tax=Paenibacillus sp. 1-18 TaxID=1333846 RepID=UPI0012DF3127|nr:hypothetical protein [Paenibacillus sp. 1-18]
MEDEDNEQALHCNKQYMTKPNIDKLSKDESDSKKATTTMTADQNGIKGVDFIVFLPSSRKERERNNPCYCNRVFNQSTEKFETSSKMIESKLTIELDFHSNDFIPAQYEAFLNKFQYFLNDNYQ